MPSIFSPSAIKFLRGLARNNDRTWFEARRDIYERELKAPMLELIEKVNFAMAEFAPDHIRTPGKTMLRIYRDTRFSADKRPYKRHIAAWFGRRSAVRTTGAGFYLHISPAEVHYAMGVFMPLPDQLLSLRRSMADRHEHFRKVLKQVTRARKGQVALEPIDARALARMPKGFPPDHPAGELLRARRWGVQCSSPSEEAFEPRFAERVIRQFRTAAPLVLALDEAMFGSPGEAAPRRRKAMF
ncbi:MAG TPA: DUF2461 domain-containing protein [Acidobacteriaceae bacterium]|jgi:uncharacterized protein (TIGR02453 family)